MSRFPSEKTALAKQSCHNRSQKKQTASNQQVPWFMTWLSRFYIKLHQPTPPTPFNLSIFFRIWLAVTIVIVVSAIVVFIQLFEYVKPTTQQVIEDTLVDIGKFLAVDLQPALTSGQISDPTYQAHLNAAFAKQLPTTAADATIFNAASSKQQRQQLATWYHKKTHSSLRIYVTDAKGVVLYDSKQPDNAKGQDYSRWNDVYLTLRGQYGARSTRQNADDPNTSVMYVAQPITNKQGQIIGVVSVGKPIATILPYLQSARQQMLTTMLLLTLITLLFAGLVAWWLRQSIHLVSRYTQSLAAVTAKPRFYLAKELNQLTSQIETMKHRLENKAYVNDYVHTLTHELKSPLTAIRASGELLADGELEADDRAMLSSTITEQSDKLQSLVEQLLLLAKIEQPTFRLHTTTIDPAELIAELLWHNLSKLQTHKLDMVVHVNHHYQQDNKQKPPFLTLPWQTWQSGNDTKQSLYQRMLLLDDTMPNWALTADRFWLYQALQNLMDNALHFACSQIHLFLEPSCGTATTNLAKQNPQVTVTFCLFNDGQHIPEFALSRVFNRYFSLAHTTTSAALSHQQNGQPQNSSNESVKGTGLGLTLVKQVAEHHGGGVSISNVKPDANCHTHTCFNPIQNHIKPNHGVCTCLQLPIKP